MTEHQPSNEPEATQETIALAVGKQVVAAAADMIAGALQSVDNPEDQADLKQTLQAQFAERGVDLEPIDHHEHDKTVRVGKYSGRTRDQIAHDLRLLRLAAEKPGLRNKIVFGKSSDS
ncbi:MAG: hypothetical protein QFB87_02280 [Patescibacteria group bacterium]|nr:hypothetical protein [Patescibacteria group bacterium]